MNNRPIKSSYSILLMRDDNTVSTFRLRAFWFKVAIIFMLLLILTCAAAIYGAVYYHGRYQSAASKRDELKTELSLAKVELQERKNLAILPGDSAGTSSMHAVNSIVQPYRPHPDQTNTGTGASGAGQGGGTSGSGQSGIGQSSSDPASTGTASTGQTGIGGGAGATTGTASASSTPPPEDVQALLGQSGPVTVAGLEHPVTVPDNMDRHPVKVSNVATSFEAGGRLKVNFDIANQPQKGTLAGVCSISVLTRQGAEVELTPVSRGSMSFRIERYRRMQAMMNMPSDLNADDIINIKVSVQVNELPLYWNLFEIKR